MSLFIGKLNPEVKAADLHECFSKHGQMLRCEVKVIAGRTVGYVTFQNDRQACDAKLALNKTVIRGSEINIEWSRSSRLPEENSGLRERGEEGGGEGAEGPGNDELRTKRKQHTEDLIHASKRRRLIIDQCSQSGNTLDEGTKGIEEKQCDSASVKGQQRDKFSLNTIYESVQRERDSQAQGPNSHLPLRFCPCCGADLERYSTG